jgi:acetyl esterase/lipase
MKLGLATMPAAPFQESANDVYEALDWLGEQQAESRRLSHAGIWARELWSSTT